MAEPCAICGATDSDTYRYCSARRAFVCLNCENACEHHSRKLLSNGTNCRLTFPPKQSFKFVTVESDVETFRKKYNGRSREELKRIFLLLRERHKLAATPQARAELRTSLAAVESLLKECG